MSNIPNKTPAAKPALGPPASGPGRASGKGSDTALEALIRQRRLVEAPQDVPAPSPDPKTST